MILRYAKPEDMEDVCRVWQASFGDSEDFVRTFFEKTNILTTTVVAECDGKVVSLMCAFDGIGTMSYLYALCTAPEYRGHGIGGEVLRETVRLAFERGAQTAALHPATSELTKWYEDCFGFSPAGYFTENLYTAGETALSAEPISFSILYDRSDITNRVVSAQEIIAKFAGGHLLKIGPALVYAECYGDKAIIKAIEGAPVSEHTKREVFSAVAAYFSLPEITVREYSAKKSVNLLASYVNLLTVSAAGKQTTDFAVIGFQYLLD